MKVSENELFGQELPVRVRVLVLGGGIHGVGVLHDLASRGWNDVHLVEKSTIGSGTSSKSTKLIHGGLRYLRRISQFPMVSESLRERKLLLDLVPDLVTPLELLIPILDGRGTSSMAVKAGLFLYDFLAQKNGIAKHQKLDIAQARIANPQLNYAHFRSIYSYWDAQTDDLALAQRVAESAVKCGSGISEGCEVMNIAQSDDGWDVMVRTHQGELKQISALYVVNCLGPWANNMLKNSSIIPTHQGFNDKGVHIVFKDIGLERGILLQSPEDQRVFFVLPWKGYTLVGTTEEVFDGDPSKVSVTDADIRYLMDRCNRYLSQPLKESDIVTTFSGLRWLAVDAQSSISSVSRESIIGERASTRGLILTIYGGKLTSYRALCEKIGSRITKHFGEYRPSRTPSPDSWVASKSTAVVVPSVISRFEAKN